MPGVILDIEQQILLLEIEPPFDKRDVQLARRRMAKRWHPDIAPAGKQFEHERHLKAINEAADHLMRLAETSRGGKVSRGAVKVSAAAARQAREEAGRRAYEAEQRAREQAVDRERNDPFGSRVPDHSVVHRYARCQSYPEWGVGTVEGIYFTDSGEEQEGSIPGGGGQQWARVKFSHGVRTVPAGSMKFVDFSKPDPAEERVERFMIAAQRAMAEGEYVLAAQRLVYARDAEPRNVGVLRLMTLAFWQAGNLEAAARSVRDWARVDGERPAPHRFAARIYEDMGAVRPGRGGRPACRRARTDRCRCMGAPGAAAIGAGRSRGRPAGVRPGAQAGRGRQGARPGRASAGARAAHDPDRLAFVGGRGLPRRSCVRLRRLTPPRAGDGRAHRPARARARRRSPRRFPRARR